VKIAESMSSSSAAVAIKHEGRQHTPAARLFQSPKLRILLGCLFLVAAVLACYNPVVHNRFIRYDDEGYITDNPHVKAGLTWSTVKWAFTTYEQANWHPLTWISHAIDYQLFGMNPAGHHYVSVLLHAVNAVLLFLLLQSTTGFRWRSLMVAALFALHPMNVESVAWASERKNVLSMLFFLLALHAYGWYARHPKFTRYSAVFGLFALALLSKPQVITFPLLLFLWDYWPLGRFGHAAGFDPGVSDPSVTPHVARSQASGLQPRQLVLEKVPLLLLSGASALVTMKAQKAGNAVQNLSQYSTLLRIETAVISYVRYLGKMFWPSKLVAMYPHPTELYPAWQVVGAVLLLVLITTTVLVRVGQQRYLAVGWFWFLGSLVPMIGLVQVGFQGMADRYAYIPFVGLFLMFTWLAADFAKARKVPSLWLAVPGAACLIALGVLSYHQVSYWRDTLSFWQRTLQLTNNNYVAEDNLGEFLFSQDRLDEAAAHFRAALAIRPGGLTANLNLGAYEDRRGNFPAAIEHYEIVAHNAGDVNLRATAYGSLGFVYREMGELLRAKQCFQIALQMAPRGARAMIGIGLIAQQEGDMAEAIRQYSNAATLQPSDVVYLLLAQALEHGGQPEQARAIYERLASSPNVSAAQREVKSLLSGK
jgi:tetratricopeptide (TPR) repeat protein